MGLSQGLGPLRAEGFAVNRKRVQRLWRLEGHRVPAPTRNHGQKAAGGRAGSTWNLQAEGPNAIWSLRHSDVTWQR